MKNTNFDVKKIIKNMQTLRDKKISEIKLRNKTETKKEEEQVTIKYLGKMEFSNNKGEMIEQDVFMTIEEVNGEFQYRYYDENMNLIGIQRTINENILLATALSGKTEKEQKSILESLESKDKDEAKTLEELEEQSKNAEKQHNIENSSEPQLSQIQVNRLKGNGPKVELNQIIDGETLGNVIGVEGKYMQLIDADEARKLIPDFELTTNQKVVPIEIYSNGTANIIGEDKLEYSAIEGNNSTEEYFTMKNDGTVENKQNIETFNIVSKGDTYRHTIAIGYDENFKTPLEAKYGRDGVYTELETVHEGPLEQDDAVRQYQKEATGVDKPRDTMDLAVERYAKAMNIRVIDEHGFPTPEYDLEAAREELESRLNENPETTVEDLIENEQKQPGPQNNKRR